MDKLIALLVVSLMCTGFVYAYIDMEKVINAQQDSIDDQSWTIKTMSEDYEQRNECRG